MYGIHFGVGIKVGFDCTSGGVRGSCSIRERVRSHNMVRIANGSVNIARVSNPE